MLDFTHPPQTNAECCSSNVATVAGTLLLVCLLQQGRHTEKGSGVCPVGW